MIRLLGKVFLLVSCSLFLFVGGAHAISIGLNFTADRGVFEPGPNPIAASDLAGVVPQKNWNNTKPQESGTTADIAGPTPGVIVDSSGSATGVTMAWGGAGNVQEVTLSGAPNNPDSLLYKDYLESDFNSGVPIVISFSNIPYTTYDVYAYVGDFTGACCISSATLGATTFFYIAHDNVPFSGYVQATGTNAGSANQANYALFSGVTGSAFSVDISKVTGNRGAIAAIEIVNVVPEPSTLLLLGSGLAGLRVWLKRRRHK